MKRILVFALMLTMGLSAAFAQQQQRRGGFGGGDPAQMLQRQVDDLKQALNLTPDQVTKITPILKDAQSKQMAQMQKMREGGTMDREKFRADRQKIQAETDAKIKPILKGDQVKKLENYRKEQQQRMQERMRNRQQ
jgi:Skp family chaperone for outer membrane proteins